MPSRPVLLAALLILLGPPARAQDALDFGDDTSAWARDGECDDPRFAGPGVASVTLEADRMADATDCSAAWEAGTATLAGGTQPGAKPAPAPAPAAAPGAVDFGDDSGQFANDGECDDRRFAGQGMAAALGWIDTGRDATDCRALFDAGRIRLWDPVASRAATRCAGIDFGTDESQFANNGACDDPRFEGPGSAAIVLGADTGADASDCRRLCDFGAVSLRDY